jgi:4-amino-4-deoxy-L-arabinose transferase-like glycosyltransferase
MQDHSLETLARDSDIQVSNDVTPTSVNADQWEIRWPSLALCTALLATVAAWLLPINAPLWLDEAGSYWEIAGGFREIASRQPYLVPAYDYILCLAKAVLGASEIALRIPSVLAMIAAVWVLYRIAREFLPADIALASCVVFSAHPLVVFAAIDARPYAFAVLVVNVAILSLLRWIRTQRTSYAIACGTAAGAIFYFHFLFSVILPAFAVVLLIARAWRWRHFWSQLLKAGIAFGLLMVPVVSRFLLTARTSQAHVFDGRPTATDLLDTFAPGPMLAMFAIAALLALLYRKFNNRGEVDRIIASKYLLFAFVPALTLFTLSSLSTLHVFTPRYRLESVPGIALCWGLLLACFDSRILRTLFCLVLVATVVVSQAGLRSHGHSWKRAVEIANANTATDHAPVLVCSELGEADFLPMPTNINKSALFATLSYYKLDSQVVPLPRSFTSVAQAEVDKFLKQAMSRHQRFLALGRGVSLPTLEYIEATTKGPYKARLLGASDGVAVVEFNPN